MAKGSPSSPAAAAADSSFPVFVDSSLDTHLAMVVSRDDNIADLKRKIRIEHALCFPVVGEITIQAIKIKRRSSFYHLSNSMLVRSAFDGIKGAWFLHIDAAPVNMMKGQAGNAENVVSENVEQSEKHVQLHAEPSASVLLDHSSDKLQGIVDKRQLLLENSLDRFTNHGNSSLPNARICQIDNLQGSLHDQIGTNDTNVDTSKGTSRLYQIPDVTDMDEEQVHEGNEEVGTHVQSKTGLVVGQEEDGGVEGSGNPDVGAGDRDASIFATKKEDSSRRSNVSVNNLILDGDSEHHSLAEKKHKETDGSFREPLLKAPATGNDFERSVYGKQTSTVENAPQQTYLQEKHLAFSEELSGEPPQGHSLPENPMDDKRKKRKRKKSSKSQAEVEPAVPSNNDDASLSHGMEEPHTKLGPYDNLVDITGTVVPVVEQTIVGSAGEGGLTKGPDATAPIEEATKNAAEENHGDPLHHNHTEWSKESDILDGLKVAPTLTSPAGVGPEASTYSLRGRKKSKNESPKNRSRKLDPALPSEYVNKENPGEASGDNSRDLHEKSVAATVHKELGEHNKPANLDVEVPSGTDIRSSRHGRKRNTRKSELTNLQSSENRIAYTSGDRVTEENCKETLGDHHLELGKESEGVTVLREAVAFENSAVVDSAVLSNSNDKKSHQKRRKSTKSKLQNHEVAQQESADSLGKEPFEEKPSETNHKDLGKESRPTTSHGEPACLGSPSKVDIAIPSKNNDKISRHRKKKLAKTELFSNISSNHDLSSRDQTTGENFEKAFRTTHGDLGNVSNDVMLPDDASQDISHGNISKLDSTGLFNDSSNKHETAHHSAENRTQQNRKELLENTHGNSSKEIGWNITHKISADSVEVNGHLNLPRSGSGKTNFIDSVLPKVMEHESVPSAKELPLEETETGKLHKGKSKRKRKSNIHSQVSTADTVKPSSSNEQRMHKKKCQDGNPANHILTDSTKQLTNKKVKTKRAHDEKTVESPSKSNMNFGDTTSLSMPPQKPHEDSRPEMTSVSDTRLKSHNHQDGTAIVHSLDEVPRPENLNAVIGGSAVGVDTQSDSADAVADLAAPSDSTEDTPRQTKRYRGAVKKVPSKRFGKVLNHSNQEEPLLATSSAIFDDAASGSSDDKFGMGSKDHMKAVSDYSSTSADSDGDLEETQAPGIKPAAYGKNNEGIDGGNIALSQSSASKKKMPLGTILRSSSSYKRAKLLASQSQAEDSESQPDVVL